MTGKKKKILFADDEETLRSLLRIILEKGGYEMLEAGDGKAALEQVKKNRPDLVILDINMPKMNGFDVLEHLKKDPKTRDIPVIMLTTRSGQGDIEEAMELDADQYIPKPFDSEKLISKIQQIFEIRGIL